MLSPSQIEATASHLIGLYEQIELDLIGNIASRLTSSGEITPDTVGEWHVHMLEQAGGLRKENYSLIAKQTGKTDKEIARILTDAGFGALEFDEEIYNLAYSNGILAYLPVPARMSPTIQTILSGAIDNTRKQFNMINTTALQSAQESFLKTINQVYLETSLGITDYNTAMRKATRTLADDGIAGVQYVSSRTGRMTHNHVDVAVRRCIVTSTAQTAGAMQLQRAKEWGSNLVEVTSHAGARPTHATWQGKIYSIEGGTKEYPNLALSTNYGSVTGLKGANCGHDFYPFFPGISERTYKPYSLKENKEIYDRSQDQRELERDIRKQKRRVMAAGDAETKKEAQLKLKEKEQELKKFLEDTGRTPRTNRQQVLGFGHSEASKAVWAKRNEVEKYDKIRYNQDGSMKVTDNWMAKKHASLPAKYKSNAVIDSTSRDGKQHNRSIYDPDGKLIKQINGGDHGLPKYHTVDDSGMHAHDIIWKDGKIVDRPIRPLTDAERKEHSDLR